MSRFFLFLFSQSIWFPILVGLVRIKTTKGGFLPFFVTLWVGLVAEITSWILIRGYHHSNAIPSNIYQLTEWLLLTWQFRIWGLLETKPRLFYILLWLPVILWITENLVFGKIVVFSPYFRVIHAFLLTLMSISEINYKITHENKSLLRNPEFMVCLGFIIYFVYAMLYEWSYQVSILGKSSSFTQTISSLFAYINVFTNGIFGIALLVIPRHKEYKFESTGFEPTRPPG
jgi:hypothetical protein